jgi:hypothetical protein
MTDAIENNDTIRNPSFMTALLAGGMAGTSVDVALFPIDTLKTRLQSPQGFLKAGGFRGICIGLGAARSAHGAALYFSTYEVRDGVDYFKKPQVSSSRLTFVFFILFYYSRRSNPLF